jgi:hypothetical protein
MWHECKGCAQDRPDEWPRPLKSHFPAQRFRRFGAGTTGSSVANSKSNTGSTSGEIFSQLRERSAKVVRPAAEKRSSRGPR